MPIGVAGATLIGAGISAAASGGNAIAQGKLNRKNRKWQEEQNTVKYNRDIEQRDYANYYNSPKSQMERFKQAGLNPHLIYGKGTSGNQTQNPTAQSSQYSGKNVQVQLDPLGELNKYQNFKKLQSETSLTQEVINEKKISNAIAGATQQVEIDKSIQELQKLQLQTDNEAQQLQIAEQIEILQNANAARETKRTEMFKATGIDPMQGTSGEKLMINIGNQALELLGFDLNNIFK